MLSGLAPLVLANVVPWNLADDYKTTTLAGGTGVGDQNGAGSNASFSIPVALALDRTTQTIYVADQDNDQIRTIDLSTEEYLVDTFAGGARGYRNGIGLAAQFSEPSGPWRPSSSFACPPREAVRPRAGLAVDPYAGKLFVADAGNHAIRTVDLVTQRVRSSDSPCLDTSPT